MLRRETGGASRDGVIRAGAVRDGCDVRVSEAGSRVVSDDGCEWLVVGVVGVVGGGEEQGRETRMGKLVAWEITIPGGCVALVGGPGEGLGGTLVWEKLTGRQAVLVRLLSGGNWQGRAKEE